jgi:hypothetical protein
VLVLIWAYIGIWRNHVSAAGHKGAYPAILFSLGVCVGLFAVTLVVSLIRKKPKKAAE